MRYMNVSASLILAILFSAPLAADRAAVPDNVEDSNKLAERWAGSHSRSRYDAQVVRVAKSGADYPDPFTAAENALGGDRWCAAPPSRKACIIHVAAGVYSLHDTIVLPPGVALVGEDEEETIITSSAIPVIRANGSLLSDFTAFGHQTVVLSESADAGLILKQVRLQAEDVGGEARVVRLHDVGGTTKIIDSDIVAKRRVETARTFVTAVEADFRPGAALRIERSHLVADDVSTTDFGGGFVMGLFISNKTLMKSLDIVDTSIDAPQAFVVETPVSQPIRITRGVIHGFISGGFPGTGLRMSGTRVVGAMRFGSSSAESILDGVSVVVPQRVSPGFAVALDQAIGDPVPRLLVRRSQLSGGRFAIVETGVPVRIENSLLTQLDEPACRVFDADGVATAC